MIIKSLDPFVPRDAREAAGRRAEEEMAFYLRRAFKDHPDLLVFNGLRFVFGEDVAQVDHLVLHRHGVILIESKSVTTKVEVNEHGEWVRWYGGAAHGMPSPVLQARRQGEFLARYLDAHAPDLLGKILLVQKRFGSMAVDVVVAVSDDGIIARPRRARAPAPPEVCKADQAADRVRAIHERHQKANSLGGLVRSREGGYWWSQEELERLRAFLLARHRPLSAAPPPPLPSSPEAAPSAPAAAATASAAVCALCGIPVSEKVEQYCRAHAGRFGGRILCFAHQRQKA